MLDLENLRIKIANGFNAIVDEYPNNAQLQSLEDEQHYWDGYIKALFDVGYLNDSDMLATYALKEYYKAKNKIKKYFIK